MLRTLALAFLLVLSGLTPTRADQPLTVFAAASMREAMEAIGDAYGEKTGTAPIFSFAGTGTLARQIEAGAPADVFVSADADWMDYVVDAGAVSKDTVRDIASNALVLVGQQKAGPLAVTPESLATFLGGHRLAMADPETVPAGRYGREALTSLGLWPAVAGSLAPMENVRVALASVARGDTPLGLVYVTDARIEPGVAVLFRLPPDSHPPIRYLAGLTTGHANPSASAFTTFLEGPEAKQILRSFGFVVDND